MDLQEFIKQTLISIAGSIVSTNLELGKNENLKHCSFKLQNEETINFDISVTTIDTSNDGVGGKISVAGFSFGGNTTTDNTLKNLSRIQFGVNVKTYIA